LGIFLNACYPTSYSGEKMIKATMLLMGLILTGVTFAEREYPSDHMAFHNVLVTGIPANEGRIIRYDETNNEFKSGGYFCAGNNEFAYSQEYYSNTINMPLRMSHSIKFSICQDEALLQCQEFATDSYVTTRDNDGRMRNDISKVSIDVSEVQQTFQSCQTNPFLELDDVVKKSIFLDDRRFSRVG
jgi:hypothetical protein